MKKILMLLIAFALICTFSVVFASCGEEDTDADSEVIGTTETQDTQSSESTEEGGDNTTDDEGSKTPAITPDTPSEPDLSGNDGFWSKNY